MNHKASNYPTEYAEDVARRARELAKSENADWKTLGQEERRQFKQRIRETDKADSSGQ